MSVFDEEGFDFELPQPNKRSFSDALKSCMAADRLWEWKTIHGEEEFFLYKYIPRSSGLDDIVTELVIAFKEGEPWAVKRCTTQYRQGLKAVAQRNPGATHYIVPIPGHDPDRQPPIPLQEVAKQLDGFTLSENAVAVDWSGHLKRKKLIRAAHGGYRPSEQEQYETLGYSGPRLSKNDVIVVIDDVFTSGRTARACRRVLREHTNVTTIYGLYLGKTFWP
ncbi:MAG: hypothetical protein QMC94_05610 [Anaerosomatales bacterium]|nr:hypothetical protein [Anaerosomatales bacterium]